MSPYDRPAFFIGHDDTKRLSEVTEEELDQARDLGYNLLTSSITNKTYQIRVLEQLSEHSHRAEEAHNPVLFPTLRPLSKDEVTVFPSETVSQLLLKTSSWINPASPDLLLAELSRRVLCQEVSYAAFCGATDILVEGPRFWKGLSVTETADCTTRYARAIKQALSTGVYVRLHIKMPLAYSNIVSTSSKLDPGHMDSTGFATFQLDEANADEPEIFDSWEYWHTIRTTCDYNARITLALSLPAQLPDSPILHRWLSEPVRILLLSGSVFVKNKHDIHVLLRTHQQLITRYMCLQNTPWILLTNVGPLPALPNQHTSQGTNSRALTTSDLYSSSPYFPNPTPAESSAAAATKSKPTTIKTAQPYIEYVRKHLQAKMPQKTAMDRFGGGYQDYLQNPLQPLTDNLESITYEVFEKDPIKYEWYERAIEAALRDWSSSRKSPSGRGGHVVLAVVGAGRGPLVTRALEASRKAGVPIQCWAVEKNPSAFVLLQRRNAFDWDDQVTLVQSDMRGWQGPYSAQTPGPNGEIAPAGRVNVDIFVSELLGSFGDNELSPECLDGAQRLLNPVHGISIPESYTAHLTPIAAPRLYADIKSRETHGEKEAALVPYVVMLQAIDYLATVGDVQKTPDLRIFEPAVKQAWEFEHPIGRDILAENGTDPNGHNRRFTRLRFSCADRGVCHGFAGYFETVLYRKSTGKKIAAKQEANGVNGDEHTMSIELSTNPNTMDAKSKDMISWFPIFFPLREPLYFPDGTELCISMWRQTDGRKVWYEWMVEAFVAPEGSNRKPIRVGASRLHSSIANACLI